MRKTLIATASAAALLASGAVIADERTIDAPQLADSNASNDSGASPVGGAQGMIDDQYDSYTGLGADFDGKIEGDYAGDDLMGRSVIDRDGKEVGKIDDLLVDRERQVYYVITDVGPYLGTKVHMVPMRIDSLERDETSNTYKSDIAREDVEGLPTFKRGQNGRWLVNN